jgi:ribosome-binding protein aMBF1 (putative translation factor)
MKAKIERGKTSNAVEILDRIADNDLELKKLTDEARMNAKVAQMIYDARQKAGLSQTELAERIGTKQAVISRLEDADYEGHSLSMLFKIAVALGKQIIIGFQDPLKIEGKITRHKKLSHETVAH